MNMEKEYIQKLLDSYMVAETTQDEEALLADYFCTHRDVLQNGETSPSCSEVSDKANQSLCHFTKTIC